MSETQDILNELNDAVKGKNMMVHKVFHYQCRDTTKCGLIKPIYLGYGVEGPEEIQKIAIASPFMGAPCDLCGGDTQHSYTGRDLSFEPRVPPAGAYVWYIPKDGIHGDHFSSVYMGSNFIAGR